MLSVNRVFQKSLPELELLFFFFVLLPFCWCAWQSNLTLDVTGAQLKEKAIFSSDFKGHVCVCVLMIVTDLV